MSLMQLDYSSCHTFLILLLIVINNHITQQMTSTSNNRFVSDIADLQKVNSSPISGYQYLPLMSLEEAVKPIVPFLPYVMSYADQAKEYCRQNTELTINESAAIYLYTMTKYSFYDTLNKTLRVENLDALKPWFAFLKLFLIAVGKLPSCTRTVWRGVYGINSSDFVENDVHTWWGVNSCSSKHSVADMFACKKGTLFCIETVYGKNITKYSANQNEKEILLMPGTCLRVKSSKSESDGLSIVHLQEW